MDKEADANHDAMIPSKHQASQLKAPYCHQGSVLCIIFIFSIIL